MCWKTVTSCWKTPASGFWLTRRCVAPIWAANSLFSRRRLVWPGDKLHSSPGRGACADPEPFRPYTCLSSHFPVSNPSSSCHLSDALLSFFCNKSYFSVIRACHVTPRT
ncbi:hypothetical protein DMH27_12790 [Raoultella planticola]|nr:hypothetical protein [Raoultella planticola]